MSIKLNRDGWPFIPAPDARIPSTRAPLTDEDFQIFLDRMPASVWGAYLAADAVDLLTTFSAMLAVRDEGASHFSSLAEGAKLEIWMECEGFADGSSALAVY